MVEFSAAGDKSDTESDDSGNEGNLIVIWLFRNEIIVTIH